MLRVKNILFPTDLSPASTAAYNYAAAVAMRFGAQLHVLHVVSSKRPKSVPDLLPLVWNDVASQLRLPTPVTDLAAPVQVCSLASTPAEGILEYADRHNVDVIVMATRGRSGLRTPLAGGVAHQIVRQSRCPVLTIRERPAARGIQRIVAPVDFSEPSRETLRVALDLGHLLGAHVDVLHVIGPGQEPSAYAISSSPRPSVHMAEEWFDRLDDFIREIDGPDVSLSTHVRVGPVAPTIINFSLERHSDLITIGSHGKTGLRRMIMGSVAEAVIRRAPCATLTVKSYGKLIEDHPRRTTQPEYARARPRFPSATPQSLL